MKVVQPIDVNNAILSSSNVAEDDYLDWDSGTSYNRTDRVNYVDPSSTVTITITSPAAITWPGHGLPVGQVVVLSTTGVLPSGLLVGTAYYIIVKTTDMFQLSSVPDGQPIITTGTQSGIHTGTASIHFVFESLRSTNIGNIPLTSSLNWLKVSSTNRWKMFDISVSSRTSNFNDINIVLDVIGRVNSVAFLNLRAASVRVIVTDIVEGVVYDRTESLISTFGITSWYAWYFNPIIRRRDILFTDLPSYRDSTMSIIITDTDNMAEVGAVVVGNFTEFGSTQYGMGLGIIDYSVKQRDSFGNTTVVERGFSRRTNLTVWVDNIIVDDIINILADIRAIPVVYEGSDQFGSSLVYGFYRDFDVVVRMPTASLLDISIEGLI